MSYYNFYDRYLVEVRGTGGRSVDQHRHMYSYFEEPNPEGEPDLVIELMTEEPRPDTVLGMPNDYYGREGDRFIVRDGLGFLSVDEDWSHIRASPNWEPFRVVYPMEFEIRKRLADEGFALIHASGIQTRGRTYLFPAWRGGGKTNTMLSLLASGGDYLSDDRLWVNGDGDVRGFPITVNLGRHNLDSFADLSDDEVTPRERLLQLVEDHANPKRSIVDKGVLFLGNKFLKEQGRSFASLTDVLPNCEYVDSADADSIVILRAAPNDRSVSVESISVSDALNEATTISHYEWNRMLGEYFKAFDTLFPGSAKSAEFEKLLATEARIFSELFASVPTHRAFIPRERDWSGTGIADDVVNKFTRLNQPAAAVH